MSTNEGVLMTHTKAEVPGFGDVWFSPDVITNIFSFAEMEDRHRIAYNSSKDHAFIVHKGDQQTKFTRMSNGLYTFKPRYTLKNEDKQLFETIAENKQNFTTRQFESAKRARQLYHALGTPSTKDFKAVIRMN
jgi:hypothetical protein